MMICHLDLSFIFLISKNKSSGFNWYSTSFCLVINHAPVGENGAGAVINHAYVVIVDWWFEFVNLMVFM